MDDKKGRKSRFVIVLYGILVLMAGVFFWKPVQVAGRIEGMKQECREYLEQRQRGKERTSLKQYGAFEELDECWRYHVIAHSCGGIDGKIYTNSKEAMELAYNNGTRMFDVDLRFTSDEELIVRHSWVDDLEQEELEIGKKLDFSIDSLKVIQISREDTPSYQEFISSLIYHKYTPMSYQDLVRFMKEKQDCYIVCDMKEDIAKSCRYIVEHTEKELLDRVIISIYRTEDLKTVKEVYPFSHIMMRQYENYPHNYSELISFCLENDIQAVAIKEKYFNRDDMHLFEEHNIKLYVAVVDSLQKYSEYQKRMEENEVGIVSNFIYENDMTYIQGESK